MFVESSVPPNTIAAAQEAVTAKGSEVSLGVRVLYSDAMGENDMFGGTYIGMLVENVISILQSFDYAIPAARKPCLKKSAPTAALTQRRKRGANG
jgi:hypothetical protein